MGKHPYRTDYKVGIDNLKTFGLDIHNPVFPLSAALTLAFISAALIQPEQTNLLLNSMKTGVIEIFDGFITWSANAFVLFCVLLAISPLGKLRIGGVDAKSDHGNLSWFAMLFAAGMGIGLMFWSVAEPLAYASGWFHTPLNVEPGSSEAYQLAMAATLYHWTIHPWAIYAIVGLSLSFFHYTKKHKLLVLYW